MMLRGTVRWAKIVGAPHKGYNPTDPKEWSFDFHPDEKGMEELKREGAGVYIKKPKNDKDHDGQPWVQFKRRETTRDGSAGKPFRIVDAQGKEWDGKTLIGNGSVVNVKYMLNEVTAGVNRGAMKPGVAAIQIVKLVPYEGGEEFPTYGEDGQEEDWS